MTTPQAANVVRLEKLIKGLRRANANYLFDLTLTVILDAADIVVTLPDAFGNKEAAVNIYSALLIEVIKSRGLVVEHIIGDN